MLPRWLVPWLLFFSLSVQAFPANKITPIRERNDAEDDDPCRDYADCSSKGLILWNTLHTTLFKDQITDRNDRTLFQRHYIPEFSHFDLPDKKFHLPLRNRGIEIVKMDYWAIYPKNPDTQENERPGKQVFRPTFKTGSARVWGCVRYSRVKCNPRGLGTREAYVAAVTAYLIERC